MNVTLPTTAAIASSVATSSGFTSFVQNHLRLAEAQVQAIAIELATIASALRGGHIGPETAIGMLHDSGLDWVTGGSS
jgi:hypothetical protein